MEPYAFFDVLVQHGHVRLVLGRNDHLPDLLAAGQQHLLFYTVGSEDLAVQGQLSSHRDPLLYLSLQRCISGGVPRETRLEAMVSESVEPSFLAAPSGAWMCTSFS